MTFSKIMLALLILLASGCSSKSDYSQAEIYIYPDFYIVNGEKANSSNLGEHIAEIADANNMAIITLKVSVSAKQELLVEVLDLLQKNNLKNITFKTIDKKSP